MAIINDPDQITPGSEVTVTPATEIIDFVITGNLSADGIDGQALYSYLKEEWKDDSLTQDLMKYDFPMLAITPEQFEFGSNGSTFSDWRLADDTARKLMRRCGWREYDSAGATLREYLGAITLGNIDSTSKTVGDKAYYYFEGDASATEFTYAGAVDEPIQIFGDASNGNFDARNVAVNDLILRIRIFGKTYDTSTAQAIGLTTLTYNAQRFPLAESTDSVISDLGVTTGDIDGNAPYTDMTIAWFAAAQTRSGFVSGTADFGVIIDGDVSEATQDGAGAASAEQIYAYVQRQLLRTTDINDGAGGSVTSYIGQFVEEPLTLASTGNTLSTNQITNNDAGGAGVYVDTFATDDKNRVQFQDNTNTAQTFPFAATGSLVFNINVQNDAAARYWLYYRYTRVTNITDLTITPTAGSEATIGSAAAVDFTATGDFGAGALTNGDYIEIDSATDPINNSIWQINSVPTASSFTAILVNGDTPASETAFTGNIYRSPIKSPDALLVQNVANTDLGDILVSGASSIPFDYDYDQDTAGGRDITADAAVVLKVIGTSTSQYAAANFTLSRSTSQTLPITAPLERNYAT